ncbi:MAG: dephospho-CoA kinase [Deltaproteobacteria bacterium RIFOXYA12_FULL_61_11]|nr:MAG: dephospho-CoA kinase [Deltaproteobacteria bacterium RIFOXYA12_FULL_61_11]
MATDRHFRVGLTGGIACGKSSVASQLRAAGFTVLELDRLAHSLYVPESEPHRLLREAFGERIVAPDGTIDRSALGRIVFASPQARRTLDSLLVPALRDRITHELGAAPPGVVIAEGALLLENDLLPQRDLLIVVTVPADVQLERLCLRDGLDPEQARLRIAAQMDVSAKAALADLRVDNGGSPEETAVQVERLIAQLKGLPSSR